LQHNVIHHPSWSHAIGLPAREPGELVAFGIRPRAIASLVRVMHSFNYERYLGRSTSPPAATAPTLFIGGSVDTGVRHADFVQMRKWVSALHDPVIFDGCGALGAAGTPR
jgi:hypothetical protein